jgi:hypothetical protein
MLIGFLKILDVYDEYQKVITLYPAMEPIGGPTEEAYQSQRLPYTANY